MRAALRVCGQYRRGQGDSRLTKATMQLSTSHPCQGCGACCAYSRAWPRFSTESEDALVRIPEAFVDASLSGMLCIGNRCAALVGEVGVATACSIYNDRPDVCRACEPGDDACLMARAHWGMSALYSGL